jgi:hypothetical protein
LTGANEFVPISSFRNEDIEEVNQGDFKGTSELARTKDTSWFCSRLQDELRTRMCFVTLLINPKNKNQ